MFFDHFAMSGGVAAAAAAGKTERSAHALRRRTATFAAAWRVRLLTTLHKRDVEAMVRDAPGDGGDARRDRRQSSPPRS